MANSRLVTEVRINKNGVPVKKHVLPEDGNKASASALPKPRISARPDDSKLRSRIIGGFDFSGKHDAYVQRVEDTIRDLPASMVKASVDQMDRFPDSERVRGAVENAIMKWDQNSDVYGLRLIAVTEVESLYDRHWKKSPLGNPLRCFSIMASVDAHLQSNNEDDISPEEDRALNYFVAASDLHMRTSGERFMSYHEATCMEEYPELLGVFREFPDRAEELAEYVIENGRDAGRARQYMRDEPLVFADGAL